MASETTRLPPRVNNPAEQSFAEVDRLRTATARQLTIIEDLERDLAESRQANDALREHVQRLEAQQREPSAIGAEMIALRRRLREAVEGRERHSLRANRAEEAMVGLGYLLAAYAVDEFNDVAQTEAAREAATEVPNV